MADDALVPVAPDVGDAGGDDIIELPSKDEKKDEKKEEPKFDLGEFADTGEAGDPPKIKAIKKDFPKIFEKYPELRSSFFRAKKYSDIFPSIDNAKEAKSRANRLTQIENEVFEGSLKGVLKRIKDVDSDAFTRITESIIEDIQGLSPEAHSKLIHPILNDFIIALFQRGEEYPKDDESGDNIKNAAVVANMFLNGTKRIGTVERKPAEKKERTKPDTTAFDNAVRSTADKVRDVLNTNLEKMITRDKVPNDYIRKTLIQDISAETLRTLSEDETHVDNMMALWKHAGTTNYDESSQKQIITTMLQKITKVLPSVRARLEAEALKDVKTNKNEDEDEEIEGDDTETPKRLENTKKKLDWSKMTMREYLDGKRVYIGG